MTRADPISAAEVRRCAVSAQGFGPRPATVNAGQLQRMLGRLGALQIDAVNVLVRSHYLPLFSRLGSYPLAMLDRLVTERRQAFEAWAHAASLVPIELYPVLRYRRTARADDDPTWVRFLTRIETERPGYQTAVLAEVTERGPLTFSELTDPARRPKGDPRYAPSTVAWDRGSDGKTMLDYLHDSGLVAVAARRGFDRCFDLTERVIPPEILAAPALEREDAQRRLVDVAARALGVAAVPELSDYFRIPVADTKLRVQELVEEGTLRSVRPEGWSELGYLHSTPWPSRPAPDCALLSPFDSLLWHRKRVQRVFGFTHTFEIYIPAAKRAYGYYVLPVLLGDELVARVDLKGDRDTGTLMVRGAYVEAGRDAAAVVGPLAQRLTAMADWLGLNTVDVARHGDLAPALRAELS